jgi:5-methylcytosine-specific restriction endonuclease McrA
VEHESWQGPPKGPEFEEWLEIEDDIIFKMFGCTCVMCGGSAVCIHEMTPRSLRPMSWYHRRNRVPLCDDCHQWAHNIGTGRSRPILKEARVKALAIYSPSLKI